MTRPPLPTARLEEILDYIRFLSEQGFLWATEGNFSLRDEEGFWITPGGKEKRHLTPDDFVWVPFEGDVPPEASSEWRFHRVIYEAVPARTVYHTHPPFTVAASHALPGVYHPILEEVRLFEGAVPVVEGPTGTQTLAERIASVVREGAKAIVLRDHGLVTLGETPQEAFHRTLRVEREFQVVSLRRLWSP